MRTLSLLLLVAHACSAAVTPPDQIKVAPGFKVELLREAGPREGSWICMTQDDKGRLYISPQNAIPESGFAKDSKWGGMWRVTLGKSAQSSVLSPQSEKAEDKTDPANPKLSTEHWALSTDPAEMKWERVNVPVGDAMGMLWAFDSLYVSGMGPQGRGIYRCKSSKGDDQLDTATLFKAIPGGAGEHGAHAIILGPDKKLYIVNGNSTGILDGLAPDSPYRNWGEDDLLPRLRDPVATFFDKIKAPYGCVYRTDADGTKWDIFAGGFRNPYDIAFNADGELFTYDSDMEWDRGLPWYRPTRLLHVVPGGEYGFREGSAKWPAYFPDSLPAVVDIGVGCPTGIAFYPGSPDVGTGAKGWPEKYRKALFLHDWTYGRILAVHLREKGASYTAQNDLASYTYPRDAEANHDVEVFLSGKGMPVTDLEFLPDGSMVFTVGGRGTASALYRVSYVEKGTASANDVPRGRVGVPPAVPGVSPGTPNAANAASRENPSAKDRNSTPDASRGTRDAAGGTPTLPARNTVTATDTNRNLSAIANAPEAQRKLAGGAASEASATTRSPSAKTSAPAEAQENPSEKVRSAAFRYFAKNDLLLDVWELRGRLEADNVDLTKFAKEWDAVIDPIKTFQNCRPFFMGDGEVKVGSLGPGILQPTQHDCWRVLGWIIGFIRGCASDIQADCLKTLGKFPFAADWMNDDKLKLLKLRALELSFARQGRPSAEAVQALVKELLAIYPAPGVAKGAAASGAPPSPAAMTPNGEAALPNAPEKDGAARGSDVTGGTPALHGAPVDDPAWRLNRELSQLLIWLTNPELGELNAELSAKAHGAPWSAAGSDSATPPSEGKRGGAEPPRTTDKPPTTAPASKGGVALTLATALQGPVPNPGASIFPGRRGDLALFEAGNAVIEKTLALMDAAPSQEEQIQYALALRWAHGWTTEQYVRYFRWFHEKAARYTGGNSFAKFVEAIRADASSRVPASLREALQAGMPVPPEYAALVEWLRPVAAPTPAAALKPRAFVKAWTLPELETALDALKDRPPDLARGKDLYTQAQCAQCHLFRDAGGNVGPDLTAVAQRFGRHDILESITDPSKVVSDQYAMVTLTILDGQGGTKEVSGLIKEETSATITLLTDPLAGKTANLYKNVVTKREKAAVSTMPPGLLYTLTAEEVADLLALFGAK